MPRSESERASLDLLGLPNLQPTSRCDEGEALIISARSREATIPRCCLLNTLVRNGTKLVRFRDHAIQGRETWVEVARQRYRCKECGKAIYEDLADIDDDRRVTKRFRQHLYQEGIKLISKVRATAGQKTGQSPHFPLTRDMSRYRFSSHTAHRGRRSRTGMERDDGQPVALQDSRRTRD